MNTNPLDSGTTAALEHPNLTDEQKQAAAAYVLRHCPDAADILERLGLTERSPA